VDQVLSPQIPKNLESPRHLEVALLTTRHQRGKTLLTQVRTQLHAQTPVALVQPKHLPPHQQTTYGTTVDEQYYQRCMGSEHQ
jgi:hypothetical protein